MADIKPVYKVVDGEWVKQTAYEIQNGTWVKISDGGPSITQLYVERTIEHVESNTITSISDYAFARCSSLKSAVFPNITSIGKSGFMNCNSLIKIVIGTNNVAGVTISSNSSNSFFRCYHILGTVDETYNPDGLKDGYIYVPLSLVADYRVATNWSEYATQIMPYVETLEELASIDGATYDKVCVVEEDYTEYTYNGTNWEVYRE